MINIEKLKLIIMEKNYILLAFLFSFTMIFMYGFLNGPSVDQYVYDSSNYYELSKRFVINGNFDFSNYGLSIRGYVFPFIIFSYTMLGNLLKLEDSISILLGNSLFISFLFIFILPSFFNYSKNKYIIIKLLLPILIFMLYWQDLVYYPLSDIYSYGFLVIAISLIRNTSKIHGYRLLIQGILIGILLYATYNIRTIYIFAIPILIIIKLICNWKSKIKNNTIYLLIILGIVICSIPQFKINEINHSKKTIAVVTDTYGESGGLFNFQLLAGLQLQRYETYIGDLKDYPQPNLGFADGVGNQLLKIENLNNLEFNQYLRLIFKHPLDYIGIIARHFFNIFHLPYNHVYIKDISHNKVFYTIINYTIIYIAALVLYVNCKKKNTIKFDINMIYLITTIIPCIAILPGAIEMRFFMPLYCLFYLIIAFFTPLSEIINYVKLNKVRLVISYIVILFTLLAIWGSTFNSAQILPQLLG